MAMIRVEWEVGKISVREPVQLSTSVQLTPLDCNELYQGPPVCIYVHLDLSHVIDPYTLTSYPE